MYWVPSKASLRSALVAALLVTGATSAAANVLVVRSSGPSARAYPPGRSLPDNARITLRANDIVVVIAGGSTRTFRGPGTYSPTAPVRAGTRTIATADGRRARVGAVRDAGIVPAAPTLWHVDASQGGTVCVADAANVMLWRADSTQSAALTITAENGGAQEVNWPAGQSTLAWPTALPVADGAQYRIRQEGVAVPTRLRFRTVSGTLDTAEAVAEALIRHECQEQLDILIETTAEASAAPSG